MSFSLIESIRRFLRHSETTRAFIFFTLLISAVFFRVIINQQTFFSDVVGLPLSTGSTYYQGPKTLWDLDPTNYMHFEVPQTIYWAQELRQGHFAFWNPYQGGGQPLSASITSGMYNPLKLLLFAAFPHWKTFDFYLLLKLLIAGFGTYLFLKKLGLSFQGALLGGAAYMFSSYFIIWITHWSLAADMMTPYLLLGIEYLVTKPRPKQVIFLGIVWAMMVLSENPEAVIVISLLSFFYFVYKCLISGKGSIAVAATLSFVLAAAIAFAISLPMLWDLSLFFSQGVTSHNLSGSADHFSSTEGAASKLSRIFHLIVHPALFLEVARVAPQLQSAVIIPTYIGVFMLLLTVAAFSFRGKNIHRRPLIFFGFVLLFFILMWLGLPPVSWIGRVPLMAGVRFLKYFGVFYFALAVLSAIGFENIKNQQIALKKFWSIILLLLIPFISLLIFSSPFRQSYRLVFNQTDLSKIAIFMKKFPAAIQVVINWLIHYPYSYAAIIFTVSIFFCLLFLFLWRSRSYTLIFVFLIIELLLYMPKLRDLSNVQDPYREPPFVMYLKSRSDMGSYRIYATDLTLMSQTATGYRLNDMSTFEGVLLRPYLNYLQPLFDRGLLKDRWGLYRSAPAELLNKKDFLPVFNRASVKYIISEQALPQDAPYKLIYDQEVKIYENDNALPLAYFQTDSGTILKSVSITAREPNAVTLTANATQDGMLVLNETNYPGWRVFVDGQEQPIITMHEMFRGVRLSKGAHTVVFNYWPLFTKDTLRALFSFGK